MDQSNRDSFLQSLPGSSPAVIEFRQPPPPPDLRVPSTSHLANSTQRPEAESSRKSQKADREKLRRDRLNEQFVELGSTLDPDRPKNDKATILADTIQLLKDLTTQVNKLKTEYTSLTEESRELTQEKNDLREEKVSLKSDIDNLNTQYQQRLRSSFPWSPMDHSMVLAPPSYPFPMPMPMAAGPIPMHLSMQPYPFFANQNPGVIPNPCSTFVPYMTSNTLAEQQSVQHVSTLAQPGGSNASGKEDSRDKSSEQSKVQRSVGSNDVTTDLELKTPGSTTNLDLSPGQRKSKESLRKESNFAEGSSSSKCLSSRSIQDSSSNSIVGGGKEDDKERRTES